MKSDRRCRGPAEGETRNGGNLIGEHKSGHSLKGMVELNQREKSTRHTNCVFRTMDGQAQEAVQEEAGWRTRRSSVRRYSADRER